MAPKLFANRREEYTIEGRPAFRSLTPLAWSSDDGDDRNRRSVVAEELGAVCGIENVIEQSFGLLDPPQAVSKVNPSLVFCYPSKLTFLIRAAIAASCISLTSSFVTGSCTATARWRGRRPHVPLRGGY